MTTQQSATRRDFLKTSAVAGGVLAANMAMLSNVHADGPDEIKIGLIGCGGRGTGAAEQCLRAGPNIKLYAMADAFRDNAEGCLGRLRRIEAIRDKIDVPAERLFVGLEAYQQVIRACDLVLLATPPGFRPLHIRAAVAARKHIFTEKPVAVDGPGIRACLQAFEDANRHRLSIVAGTQRRYQTGYLESMRRVQEGALGTLLAGRCYWNQGGIWDRIRTPQMTEVEWQMRNWYYYTWLCGDHIVEQHVHNLDVINWALGNSHPTRCVGVGGRASRTQPQFGHIFDHFAVDYEYPNNFRLMSMCRQFNNCENNISEALVGSRGAWQSQGYRITGERPWSFSARNDNNPYQDEHVALINAIRNARPINDLKNVAESTLTAIMGRMACYTGRAITWDDALNSQQNLMPERLNWDTRLTLPPVAVPGQTQIN